MVYPVGVTAIKHMLYGLLATDAEKETNDRRIRFSDGHDTGIYTWKYLHSLCAKHGQPPASS